MSAAVDPSPSVGSVNLDGGVHHIPIPGLEGRMWLCGKHAIAPCADGVLERTGAAHVVCLVHRHELSGRYDDYIEWLDAATDAGRATWFPIHDMTAPEPDGFEALARDLHRRLVAGDGLVVHCAAGMGRAGTLAVAVCILSGMSLETALDHVRVHRPGAGPEVGDQLSLVRGVAAGCRAVGDPGLS